MSRIAVAAVMTVLCGFGQPALAETPVEDAFFAGPAIVAHWHFLGPTKHASVWLRRDGRVLARWDRSRDTVAMLESAGAPGWTWRLGLVDAALVRKIERLARESGVCAAHSHDGASVGGAWTLAVDYGSSLRCAFHTRAHLDVDAKLRRFADAVSLLPDAIVAEGRQEGVREDRWELGALAPMR